MPSDILAPGTRFQDWIIHEVLGIGGFGITYKAQHHLLDASYVAIKEYMPTAYCRRLPDGTIEAKPDKQSIEYFQFGLEKFLAEAQELAKFSHPNIVRVSNFYRLNGTAYIVLEYATGQTLDIWAAGLSQRADEQLLLNVFLPLLDGVQEMHSHGILHRDIKPSNICMQKNNHPILIDFGAVKNLLRSHTHSAIISISEGFSPKEQYASSTIQGAWTDIYALGATIRCLIDNATPPGSTTRHELVSNGSSDPLVPATKAFRGKYTTRFLETIDWCLELNSKDRPQTIAELKQGLLDGRQTLPAPKRHYDVSETDTVVRKSSGQTTTISADRQRVNNDDNSYPEQLNPENKSRTMLLLALLIPIAIVAILLGIFWRGDNALVQNESEIRTESDTTLSKQDNDAIDSNLDEPIIRTPEPELLVDVRSRIDKLKELIATAEALGTVNLPLLDSQLLTVNKQDTNSWQDQLIALDQTIEDFTTGIATMPREVRIGITNDEISVALQLCLEFDSDCSRDWYADELERSVTLTPFVLDRYEVSFGKFAKYTELNNVTTQAEILGRSVEISLSDESAVYRDGLHWANAYDSATNSIEIDNFPITHVTAADARAYCEFVNKRLPTEAEWESVARGAKRYTFTWGNEWQTTASYWADSAVAENTIAPIGSFTSNEDGYYDLVGSVTEWTSSVGSTKELVLMKGASRFDRNIANMRLSVRREESAAYSGDDVGFRCAQDVSEWPNKLP